MAGTRACAAIGSCAAIRFRTPLATAIEVAVAVGLVGREGLSDSNQRPLVEPADEAEEWGKLTKFTNIKLEKELLSPCEALSGQGPSPPYRGPKSSAQRLILVTGAGLDAITLIQGRDKNYIVFAIHYPAHGEFKISRYLGLALVKLTKDICVSIWSDRALCISN